MTLPPMNPVGPQLSMSPDGIFPVPGRGTVVTGQLQGQGWLNVGDDLVCEGEHWPVTSIEMVGSGPLKTAEPGAHIGVLLRSCNAPDLLRGKTVQFVPNASQLKAGPAPGRGFGRKCNRRQG